jgi:retron-type reverse transcriptase
MEDGSIVPRTAGTPLGGVISPLLANLFLHYAFDAWMARRFHARGKSGDVESHRPNSSALGASSP